MKNGWTWTKQNKNVNIIKKNLIYVYKIRYLVCIKKEKWKIKWKKEKWHIFYEYNEKLC